MEIYSAFRFGNTYIFDTNEIKRAKLQHFTAQNEWRNSIICCTEWLPPGKMTYFWMQELNSNF